MSTTLAAMPAAATSLSFDNQALSITTNLFAYVPAGGSLDVDLHVIAAKGTQAARPSIRILVISPSGVQTELNPGLVSDETRDVRLTASLRDVSEGVWSIAAYSGTPLKKIPTGYVSSATNVGYNVAYAQDSAVTPRDQSGASLAGQVWTENLSVSNYLTVNPATGDWAASQTTEARTLYHLSERGVVYRTIERGYNGWYSILATDNYGIVDGNGSCTRTYAASITSSPVHLADPNVCPGYGVYRIFFEPPSKSMPATARWFDGRTRDSWVRPTYGPAGLLPLDYSAYTQSAATAVWGGTFQTEVRGYNGTLIVEIDADGNGSYDDPLDVRKEIPNQSTGTVSVDWDGKDSAGTQLSLNDPVKVRVSWEVPAEIHFISRDVELRDGGIEIEMVEGPAPGDNIVHWNDDPIAQAAGSNYVGTAPDPISTGGPNDPGVNSAGGVHTWGKRTASGNATSGSWGDSRAVDDYSVFIERVEQTLELNPGIAIDKVSDHDPAGDALTPAGVVTHTVQIRNTGNVNLVLQTMVDDLKDVLTRGDFVDGSLQASSGTPSFDAEAKTIRWTGDLGPAATTENPDVPDTVTISYQIKIKEAGGTVTDGDLVDTACIEGWLSDEGLPLCDSTSDAVSFPAFGFDLRKIGQLVGGPMTDPLDGAQFELRIDDNGAPGAIATRTTVSDVDHAIALEEITIDPVDGSTGHYRAVLVPPGRYWLVESQAPAGYVLWAQPICLEATAERVNGTWAQTLALCNEDGGLVTDPVASGDPLLGADGHFTFDATNVQALTLPNTGGADRGSILLLGGTGLISAVVGTAIWLRRRPRASAQC